MNRGWFKVALLVVMSAFSSPSSLLHKIRIAMETHMFH